MSSPSVQSLMHTPQSPFPPLRVSSTAITTASPAPFPTSQTPAAQHCVQQPFLSGFFIILIK